MSATAAVVVIIIVAFSGVAIEAWLERRATRRLARMQARPRHPGHRPGGPDDGKGCLTEKQVNDFAAIMFGAANPTGVEPPRRQA